MSKDDLINAIEQVMAQLAKEGASERDLFKVPIITRDGSDLAFSMGGDMTKMVKEGTSGPFVHSSHHAAKTYYRFSFNYANYPSAKLAREDACVVGVCLPQMLASLRNGSCESVVCEVPGMDAFACTSFSVIRISSSGKAKHQTRGGILAVRLNPPWPQ